MCTPWFFIKLAKCHFKVMCKCSYHLNEEGPITRRKGVFPPSVSSSPSNPVSSSPSSPVSQREISTTFFSSPRSQGRRSSTPKLSFSPRQSSQQPSEPRSTVKDEGDHNQRSRLFLPQLKRGKLKRRVTIGSNSSGSADVDEPDWPPFADEDYIVFCFEEDGAFHVVMEESPRTLTPKLQCEDHGNVSCACTDENKDAINFRPISRRDCLLAHIEEEQEKMMVMSGSQLSPKMQKNDSNGLVEKEKFVIRNESTVSMECRNGSVESTDSSRLDWEEEQLHDEANPGIGILSPCSEDNNGDTDSDSPDFRRDCLLPNKVVDEVFLSPKQELGKKMTIDDLLNVENERFSTGSDQSSGFSGSDDKIDQEDQEEQHDENQELGLESPKSSASDESDSSSNSFEFPVLELEWIGSPVIWKTSGRIHSASTSLDVLTYGSDVVEFEQLVLISAFFSPHASVLTADRILLLIIHTHIVDNFSWVV